MALLVAVCGAVHARPVAAQSSTLANGRRGSDARVEVSGGLLWLGQASLGARDAELRANAASAQPLRVFASTTRLAAALGASGRVAVALTRRFAVEGAVAFGRPSVESSLSVDVERAPSISARVSTSEYLFEGGVAIRIAGRAPESLRPFVAVGGGLRRQIYEGRALVEQGSAYYVGAGVRRSFLTRSHGAVRSVGWRADGRLYVLRGGLPAGDEGVRRRGRLDASVFLRF